MDRLAQASQGTAEAKAYRTETAGASGQCRGRLKSPRNFLAQRPPDAAAEKPDGGKPTSSQPGPFWGPHSKIQPPEETKGKEWCEKVRRLRCLRLRLRLRSVRLRRYTHQRRDPFFACTSIAGLPQLSVCGSATVRCTGPPILRHAHVLSSKK